MFLVGFFRRFWICSRLRNFFFQCLSPSELAAREEQCLLKRSEDIEERPLLQQQPSGSAETPPLSPQEAASELFIPRDFKFSLEPDYDFDKLAAIVTMPSGKHDVAQIKVSDSHFCQRYSNNRSEASVLIAGMLLLPERSTDSHIGNRSYSE